MVGISTSDWLTSSGRYEKKVL